MDVLSSILVELQPRGRVFCRGSMTAPWGLSGGEARPIFHAIVRGQGVIKLDDGEPKPVGAGDLVLLLRGGVHVLADAPDTVPADLFQSVCRAPDRQVGKISIEGGGGATTTVICGTFAFAGGRHPLIDDLPDLLVVHTGIGRWLEMTLGMLEDELREDRPGCELVGGRLCEILLVHALRAHLQTIDADAGFAAALADPQIGRALALIHTRQQEGWGASTLADRVGMSRSSFFSRFKRLVGEPPASYIARVAMERAASCLADPSSSTTVSELADRLGYSSESAFSRAFTHYHGQSPRTFRKAHR